MSSFIREERYLVLKYSDLKECLSEDENETLHSLVLKNDSYRRKNGKPILEAVVIEKDWPEYETVWKMLETRVQRDLNHESKPIV